MLTELDKSGLAVPWWAVRFHSPCFRLLACDKDASHRGLLC